MNITVKKVVLAEQKPQVESQTVNKNYLGLVADIEVQCTVRIGTLNLTIGELKDLKTGQVIHLEQKTNHPIELILNDKVIARGELMSYEEQFAMKITEVLG